MGTNGVRRLWVVEVAWEVAPDRWEPTGLCYGDRRHAAEEVRLWRRDCPHDQFRLVAYVPEVKERKKPSPFVQEGPVAESLLRKAGLKREAKHGKA